MNIARDASDFNEASYDAHPVDFIEPLPEKTTAGAEAFLRILGWLG